MDLHDLRNELVNKGLKIIPQRIVVLEALHTLKIHPTADEIQDIRLQIIGKFSTNNKQ